MNKKKENGKLHQFRAFFTEGTVRFYDWLILAALMLFCFLSYEMRDLFHTAGCSYGFLDGHILDFYDYLAAEGIAEDGTIGLHASYMPTVYLIFALWNLPMKLLHIVPKASADLGFLSIMWSKILPCLVFILSGFTVFGIAKELGMEDRKSKLAMYAYLSMPVALFGQFILGQYESFLVFCIVLGTYFWLKRKQIPFVLMFAIGMTFKYTALIFFLPLLLLREKKIPKILLSLGLAVIPYALEYLIYMHSPAFKAYVFGVGAAGDNPTGYITNAAYFTGFTFSGNLEFVVYLAFVAFAFVVAYAYFKKVDEKEEGRYAMYIGCLAAAALFCFSKWHPHWLMAAVPFWVLSAFLHRDTKIFMAIDLIFAVLFMLFCAVQFDGITDEIMLSKGIFKFILPDKQIPVYTDMSEYMDILDMSVELTLLTAIMGVYAVFKHPKYMSASPKEEQGNSIGWIRARYLIGLMVFIVPSLLCLKNARSTPALVYDEDRRGIFVNMEDEGTVSQPFVSKGTEIKKLIFPVSRGASYDTPVLGVSLKDADGQLLFSDTVNVGHYYEGQLVRVKPGKLKLNPGETYYVEFTSLSAVPDSTFCLLAFDQGDFMEAKVRGSRAAYHMNLRIYQ